VKAKEAYTKSKNTFGGYIFKKMLEDKNAISTHLQNGRALSDLKDTIKFAKPISIN
jgi:hypothetical protein